MGKSVKHTLLQKKTFLKNRKIRDHFTKIMSNWDLKGWNSSINEEIILRKTTLIALSLNTEDDKKQRNQRKAKAVNSNSYNVDREIYKVNYSV